MKPVFSALALIFLFFSCTKPMPSDEAEQKIRKMLLLPAYEHVYRDVIYFNEERSFVIFRLYKKELLFSVNIRVQAGVDLKDGYSLNIDGPDSVRITLPRAKILLADADESSIEEMFLTEKNKEIKLLDYYTEIDAKKEEIINHAVAGGILVKAEENIKFILENFFMGAGYRHVSILFRGGPDESTP